MTYPGTEAEIPAHKLLKINNLSISDLGYAFKSGLADFAKTPLKSGFFGLVYSLGFIFILTGLVKYGKPWLIIPIAVGFPLLGPFVSASLYEMSRRRQDGREASFSEIFKLVLKREELRWMAFVVLFVFWIWIYQVRILLAIFLRSVSMSSIDQFWTTITTTMDGFMFLGVGTIVGGILSTILYSLTVTSMPMLLDRDIDFITAMIFSVKTVLINPFTMLTWGVLVAILAFAAMIPAFVGLIIVLPVLGHATWHLYTRAIGTKSPEEL